MRCNKEKLISKCVCVLLARCVIFRLFVWQSNRRWLYFCNMSDRRASGANIHTHNTAQYKTHNHSTFQWCTINQVQKCNFHCLCADFLVPFRYGLSARSVCVHLPVLACGHVKNMVGVPLHSTLLEWGYTTYALHDGTNKQTAVIYKQDRWHYGLLLLHCQFNFFSPASFDDAINAGAIINWIL